MSIRKVSEVDDLVPVKVVLASVFDKSGLEELATGLVELCPDVKIVSTGGTYGKLQQIFGEDTGKYVAPVTEFTGAPETEGGLVKTLSREVSLGLLTETYSAAHQEDLKREGVQPIDVVACNLYPFSYVVAKTETTPEGARGNIDIGGPTMIRSAAKNHLRCVSMVNPADYAEFLEELKTHEGRTTFGFRFRCYQKAMEHTAAYDTAIAKYLKEVTPEQALACFETVHNKV